MSILDPAQIMAILKECYIAKDSVVATGSVFTKGIVESGVVIAGNPARIVKRGIIWSRERFPLDVKCRQWQ